MKFAARLASVRIGAPISTPTSAHVPHAMIAARSSAAGTPTYADAVSCDPTWPTVTPAGSPVAAATSGSRGPTGSPGWAIGGKIERGSPSSSIRSVAQSRVATSNSPVVDAFVASAATTPVSRWPMRSGISSIRSARGERRRGRARRPAGRRVLMPRNCTPVRCVQPLRRDDRVDAGDRGRPARVAVVERLAERRPGRVDQPVVDRPRVDARSRRGRRRSRDRPRRARSGSRRRSPRCPSAGRRRASTGPFGKRWTSSSVDACRGRSARR